MRIFLDTNVLLDHALDRQDTFADEANLILDYCEGGVLKGLISTGSWYSLTYVLRKRWGNTPKLTEKLLEFLSLLEVVSTDSFVLRQALAVHRRDLEDAYQYFTALHHQADYFITANLKDFRPIEVSTLPVVSPSDFLKIWTLSQ